MKSTYEAMENLSPEEKREAEQLYRQALQKIKHSDYSGAAELYDKAAAYGHPGAQNNLGAQYIKGRGVEKNLKKAFALFSESARHGNTNAMVRLGLCYTKGYGTEVDFDAAVEWWETAADKNDVSACVKLAEFYVDQDEGKKFYWYSRAASLGNTASMLFMGAHYRRDYEKTGSALSLALAKIYLDEAASAGTSEIKLRAAALYDVPDLDLDVISYEALDLERARTLYTEVLSCDDDSLRLEAAKGLDETISRDALDLDKAIDTYRALADAGNTEACRLMGQCYEEGKGNIQRDLNRAGMFYEKAGDKFGVVRCQKSQSAGGIGSHGKEYYSKDFDCGESAYGGRIYYIASSQTDKVYVASSDFDGEDIKIVCELPKDTDNICWYDFIHANSSGIFVYSTVDYDRLQILHYDYHGRIMGTFSEICEGTYEDGYRIDNIYFYDIYCYFVYSHPVNGVDRAVIKRIDVDNAEKAEILYRKANRVDRLYASDKILIFRAYYDAPGQDDTASGWMMMDLETKRVTSLSNPYCSPEMMLEHPERYDCDSAAFDETTRFDTHIRWFDMDRMICWTERREEGDCYWEPHEIGGDLQTAIAGYPVWRIPSSAPTGGRRFFDGKHYYCADGYYSFKSYDKSGNEFDWHANLPGHGDCQNFRVMGEYLFLDIEALGEDQYNLTDDISQPIRKSWFKNALPDEAVERYEAEDDVII